MKSLLSRTVAVVAALAVSVAACGDDGDVGAPIAEDPDPADATTSSTTTTTDPPTSSADGGEREPIVLGYTQIDFDQLREQYSIDLNFQNAEPVLDALVADLNDNGGIHGRMVEVRMEAYLPVGAASAEEVCIKFTEDDPVFAVLGGFSGPGAVDVNSCIVAEHDTILLGGTGSDAQKDAATAPWLQVDMTSHRRSIGFARALGEHGHLDGTDAIAVIGAPESEPFLADVETALAESGAQVVLNTTLSGGDAEIRTLLERAVSSGASAVYYSGLNPALYPAFADYDVAYFFDDATTTEPSLRDFQANGGTLDVISNGTFPLPFKEDAAMADCIDIVESRTDITVEDPNTLPDDQPNWWEAVSRACQNLRLFQHVAEGADADLTNESFLAAAEALGEVELPGVPHGSLGPGKYDVSDTTRIVRWDPGAHDGEGGWEPLGDLHVID